MERNPSTTREWEIWLLGFNSLEDEEIETVLKKHKKAGKIQNFVVNKHVIVLRVLVEITGIPPIINGSAKHVVVDVRQYRHQDPKDVVSFKNPKGIEKKV